MLSTGDVDRKMTFECLGDLLQVLHCCHVCGSRPVYGCIVCPHKKMGETGKATSGFDPMATSQNAAGIQTAFHNSKNGATPKCPPGSGWSPTDAACVPIAELEKAGKCPWGTAPVKNRAGKVSCRPSSLPYGASCPVVDMRRPTWLDPASKIQVADVALWAGGGLADKGFINAVKLQGAMEALQELVPAGSTPYAALTKTTGLAHSVVSHLGVDGQQGTQQFGTDAFKGTVPGTLAARTRPTAAALFAATGF
jgi:hypothetical protein